MRPGDLAVLIGRYGTRCLAALLVALVLWLPLAASAAKCDYTGVDQP